jgi:DNA-binding FrmR family transcriptional regulator
MTHAHPAHHLKELPRLNRVAGQITGIKKMIEEDRHCPDILIQLRAVRSALKTIEAGILERHLEHCLSESLSASDPETIKTKIDELKQVFKRYDE